MIRRPESDPLADTILYALPIILAGLGVVLAMVLAPYPKGLVIQPIVVVEAAR